MPPRLLFEKSVYLGSEAFGLEIGTLVGLLTVIYDVGDFFIIDG